MSTPDWLRELGAEERPLRYSIGESFLLGPIECDLVCMSGRFVYYCGKQMPLDDSEHWYVHGIPTARPLTREDCERILRVVEGGE